MCGWEREIDPEDCGSMRSVTVAYRWNAGGLSRWFQVARFTEGPQRERVERGGQRPGPRRQLRPHVACDAPRRALGDQPVEHRRPLTPKISDKTPPSLGPSWSSVLWTRLRARVRSETSLRR